MDTPEQQSASQVDTKAAAEQNQSNADLAAGQQQTAARIDDQTKLDAPDVSDETKQRRRTQQLDVDLKTTARWLFTAFLAGWCGLLLRLIFTSINIPGSFLATGAQTATAFVWTLAWVAGGFVFGFVFGIPKVITATTSTTNPALNTPPQKPVPKLKVNTNLEDISDWLTKVLVGATLTQIAKIPPAVRQAAWFMSLGETGSHTGFNGAIILYYSALGSCQDIF